MHKMAILFSSAPITAKWFPKPWVHYAVKLGADLDLYTCEWAPLWVVDFPMFEVTEQGLSACHHPFTSPSCSIEELKANPAPALSRAYDMVLNGTELGGGSIRIHDQNLQQAVFEILGITPEQQREKFGFLLDALKFGAPPTVVWRSAWIVSLC